jgi:hypothetical protein
MKFAFADSQVIDKYIAGQRCDETDDGRSIEVEMTCCANIPGAHEAEQQHKRLLQQQVAATKQQTNSKNVNNKYYEEAPTELTSFILSVSEPAVCNYHMTVCVPKMCFVETGDLGHTQFEGFESPTTHGRLGLISGNPIDSEAAQLLRSENLNLVTIMKALNTTCLHKQVDWWTYELCFAKGIRQFHLAVENVKMDNGMFAQRQSVQTQFVIGVVSNSTTLYSNLTLLHLLADLPAPPPSTLRTGSSISGNKKELAVSEMKEPLKLMHETMKQIPSKNKNKKSKKSKKLLQQEIPVDDADSSSGGAYVDVAQQADDESDLADQSNHAVNVASVTNNAVTGSKKVSAIPTAGLPSSAFKASEMTPASLKVS